mgnify:CR=1 FL=1
MLGRQRGLQGGQESLQGEAGRGGVGDGDRVAVLPAGELVRVHGPEGAVRGGAPLGMVAGCRAGSLS